jgi:hypothetical protein
MGDVTRRFVSEMFVMAAKRAGVPVKAAKQMFRIRSCELLPAVNGWYSPTFVQLVRRSERPGLCGMYIAEKCAPCHRDCL